MYSYVLYIHSMWSYKSASLIVLSIVFHFSCNSIMHALRENAHTIRWIVLCCPSLKVIHVVINNIETSLSWSQLLIMIIIILLLLLSRITILIILRVLSSCRAIHCISSTQYQLRYTVTV